MKKRTNKKEGKGNKRKKDGKKKVEKKQT